MGHFKNSRRKRLHAPPVAESEGVSTLSHWGTTSPSLTKATHGPAMPIKLQRCNRIAYSYYHGLQWAIIKSHKGSS